MRHQARTRICSFTIYSKLSLRFAKRLWLVWSHEWCIEQHFTWVLLITVIIPFPEKYNWLKKFKKLKKNVLVISHWLADITCWYQSNKWQFKHAVPPYMCFPAPSSGVDLVNIWMEQSPLLKSKICKRNLKAKAS